jgi:hypothetical protein
VTEDIWIASISFTKGIIDPAGTTYSIDEIYFFELKFISDSILKIDSLIEYRLNGKLLSTKRSIEKHPYEIQENKIHIIDLNIHLEYNGKRLVIKTDDEDIVFKRKSKLFKPNRSYL